MIDHTTLAKEVVKAILSVVGTKSVGLHEPTFSGNEILYLKECIDSTFVSSVGKFVDRFEDELAQFTGAKYAVAVVNGTAALHIALKLAGVEAGDEVLTPALTFVATSNAVAYCNATPHFVDIEMRTLGVDAIKLRSYLNSHTEQRSGKCINLVTGKVIRALLPMHAFGHPVDLEGVLSIAKDFNIVLVEDAAESLGSYYHGKHTGTFGRMGTLSFNGNKTITTGGGGAILTNDAEIARYAKHLTTTAKIPHAWEFRHDEVGYNYRLPNLNAALGCAQIEHLNEKLTQKKALFNLYQTAFSKVEGIKLFKEPPRCSSNYWLQTLILDSPNIETRDVILKVTNEAGFMTRPAWALMDELNPFKNCPKMDLTTARLINKSLINIPSSSKLGLD
jgi:dTDP-4-amino-4,6-dideoxygalactose transaminase